MMLMNKNKSFLNIDCLEGIKQIDKDSINCIITDPPYDDYHTDIYKQTPITFLNDFKCPQLVFWSAKTQFPLNYNAIHIWDKKTGVGSEYERIFERNTDNKQYSVFRYYLINSTVAASYNKEEFFGHPSQKPLKLMLNLVNRYTKEGDTILDPFAGSGTTLVACQKLRRNFIGFEIDKTYFDIGNKRLQRQIAQVRL